MYSRTVSVIMPASNAEQTLKQAVDSILLQSFPHWELLIIENGSDDNTKILAEELAQTDERIRVLSCEKGLSRARNLGIAEAGGTWLTFVDAADCLAPGALGYFAMKTREYRADMIMGAVTDGTTPLKHLPADIVYSGKEAALGGLMRFMHNADTALIAPAKLFSLETLRREQVFFDESLNYSEDHDFCIRYLTHGTTIVQTFCPVYIRTPDMPTPHPAQDNLLSEQRYMPTLESIGTFIKEQEPSLQKAFYGYCTTRLLNILSENFINTVPPVPREAAIREIKNTAKGLLFEAAATRCGIKHMPAIHKIGALLLKIHCRTGVYLLLTIRRKILEHTFKKNARR